MLLQLLWSEDFEVARQFYEERGQGVENTRDFSRGMNRAPCLITKNYKSNKGINYLLTCTELLR